ncbi:MAG: chemotaxis protein CheW [Desulfuromonas sp.]|nr:MAG: chemotaxis protein CheW [Desulfuromonas sp.]
MEATQVEAYQYLTFRLDAEAYGVDVSQVREVLDSINITRVPKTPAYMLGVINLRGSVVPVVDLRQRFGMPSIDQTRDTCIIVLEVMFGDELVVVGALTDAVEEVLDILAGQIEPPPKLGSAVNVEFIRGMGKVKDDSFVMLLDIDKMFSSEELSILSDSTSVVSAA